MRSAHPTLYIYNEIMDYLFCEIIYFLLSARMMMMMMMPPPCTSSATFNIYIYKETMDCFMFFCFEQEVWSMMTPCVTISDDGMRLMCCFHHSSVYIYISLMIMKLWIVLWDYLFSALNKYCSFQICFGCLVWSITQVISTRQETPSIVCPKQVLWTGFKFVLLSRLINYASDYNAPQKRLVLKKYLLFYIYI